MARLYAGPHLTWLRPVVVLTPNLCGRDGISRLARLVIGAFDDATVLALHEPAAMTRFDAPACAAPAAGHRVFVRRGAARRRGRGSAHAR